MPEPWFGITVDDVAAMVPAREAVPLVTHNGTVYIIPQSDVNLHFELTGTTGDFTPDSKARPHKTRKFASQECRNPLHDSDTGAAPVTICQQCGNQLLLFRPGRRLCERCRPMMLDPA
jgi:hypothetical protein